MILICGWLGSGFDLLGSSKAGRICDGKFRSLLSRDRPQSSEVQNSTIKLKLLFGAKKQSDDVDLVESINGPKTCLKHPKNIQKKRQQFDNDKKPIDRSENELKFRKHSKNCQGGSKTSKKLSEKRQRSDIRK